MDLKEALELYPEAVHFERTGMLSGYSDIRDRSNDHNGNFSLLIALEIVREIYGVIAKEYVRTTVGTAPIAGTGAERK